MASPLGKVCLVTNGCPENRIDAARMTNLFRRSEWEIVEDYRAADWVVFNACALTEASEDLSMRIVDHLRTFRNPPPRLTVCGCLPKINLSRLRDRYEDVVFGSDDLDALARLISAPANADDIQANHLIPHSNNARLNGVPVRGLCGSFSSGCFKRLIKDVYRRFRYRGLNVGDVNTWYIKVSTGCLSDCAYCAVKLSRGELRSKPVARIVEEYEEGLDHGYTDFALIGTDLGCYGRDINANLVDLVDELIGRNGARRINLRNLHPRFLIEMTDGLRRILRTGKVSLISTAAQSGSDRVLERMKRFYRIADLKDSFRALKDASPETALRSQFMVGFPGETDEDFRLTMQCVEEMNLDYVESYRFQPRPGTPAAEMDDRVPAAVARRRHLRLLLRTILRNRRAAA